MGNNTPSNYFGRGVVRFLLNDYYKFIGIYLNIWTLPFLGIDGMA